MSTIFLAVALAANVALIILVRRQRARLVELEKAAKAGGLLADDVYYHLRRLSHVAPNLSCLEGDLKVYRESTGTEDGYGDDDEMVEAVR